MDPERLPDPTSQIAQERVQPGPPALTFWVALGIVGVALFGVLIAIGLTPTTLLPAEAAAASSPLGLVDRLGTEASRILSAASVASAAICVALAGRRLLHSDGAGILAAAILALDPGTLALGRLALPDSIALGALAGALACFLSARDAMHWVGSGLLALAALAEPTALLWGIPLGTMALLRGHIYAAPRHLGESLLQGIAIPGAVALVGVVSGVAQPPCVPPLSALTLSAVPFLGGIALAHNPILWLGGLGSLAILAIATLVGMGRQVRVARLPGRLQLRLPDAVHPMAGRILWLAALGLVAPFPGAWMIVAALGLAAGVVWLSEDAPGFGLAVALVVVGFGVIGLARSWSLVTGAAADPAVQLAGLLPWSHAVACPP